MKTVFYFMTFLFSVTVVAQNNTVVDKLKEYNLPSELLAKSIGGAEVDADHSFDVTITSSTDSEMTVEEATYNPTQKKGKRWILLTSNGKDPSKKEINEFKKDHNMKEDEIKAKIDDASWNIESDNDEYLVVSYKYDKSTVHKRHKFLVDIEGKAYFNKNTKLIEKVEYVNTRPTKIKPFNVDKYNMVVNYI